MKKGHVLFTNSLVPVNTQHLTCGYKSLIECWLSSSGAQLVSTPGLITLVTEFQFGCT